MRTYNAGRSTDGWAKGELVLSLAQVPPGTVLIGVSHQFQAENLYLVTDSRNKGLVGKGFTVQYVAPDLTPTAQDGHLEQWVWADDLNHSPKEWYLAIKLPEPPRTLPAVPMTVTLVDQSDTLYDGGARQLTVTMRSLPDGSLGMEIPGYGDADSVDGFGLPVVLELWEGRLRLVVWNDINRGTPKVIDMEDAREDARKEECPTCGVVMENYPADLGRGTEQVYGCHKCDGLEKPCG